MANFTMASKTESLMSMIYKSQSNYWPTGEAHLGDTAIGEISTLRHGIIHQNAMRTGTIKYEIR